MFSVPAQIAALAESAVASGPQWIVWSVVDKQEKSLELYLSDGSAWTTLAEQTHGSWSFYRDQVNMQVVEYCDHYVSLFFWLIFLLCF